MDVLVGSSADQPAAGKVIGLAAKVLVGDQVRLWWGRQSKGFLVAVMRHGKAHII